MSYDYIVVGAGAAGSVVAHQLSTNPSTRVLLLEAGGTDRHPINLVPKGFYFTMSNPRFSKTFVAGPYGAVDATEPWHRGRVLGGSTTTNGMIWNRGWAPDYDALVDAGNAGWGWREFLDAFRYLENHQLGGSELRGTGGRVDVSIAAPPDDLSEALIAAAEADGLRRVDDWNGTDDERIAYVPSNIGKGLRVSSARAFLRPALRRENLTVVTGAEVHSVVLDHRRATGVLARVGGSERTFSARREVLLCGGTLDTPLLLERSGIGHPAVLHAAGLPLRVESPNVGEKLTEHRGMDFRFRITGAEGQNKLIAGQIRRYLTGARYLVERNGIMSYGGFNVIGAFAAHPDATRPDAQIVFTPVSIDGSRLGPKRAQPEKEPGAMLSMLPLRPTSRGSIHSTGARAGDVAAIAPNFLATEHDREVLAHGARRARGIAEHPEFGQYVARLTKPVDLDLSSDEALAHHAINFGNSGYHTVGTAAMGPDDDDVVDANLRVRGTENLRVIDASVFPHITSGNINAPTMALALIASGRILQGD
ncbi:GMC family oxidoreductase N-terminal domain-containing protein [Aeromicrobium sp. YIM 150415]|uniref:GMC family oxidoreductase n=1 Tax=Aeromicrobium sp. YIM 150415 TaxID=2803912 RepID=UPI0019664809|nr:GMC family oxidoreductase N-terminal domain-containing protein [Aeromicrobium sp. YIM 150415]MBM9463573.1 GMC family oxidoreductase N-terminal domain-containing protein [Aeromicrobium sp. YIM 150415]